MFLTKLRTCRGHIHFFEQCLIAPWPQQNRSHNSPVKYTAKGFLLQTTAAGRKPL